MQKKAVITSKAPPAIGPYHQAVIFDPIVYCSGQIGLLPESGLMVADDTASQMTQAMNNLNEILKAAGSDWNKVLKCTIYLVEMEEFSIVNEIYAAFFPDVPPARELAGVKSLPKNARVEISCIAHL